VSKLEIRKPRYILEILEYTSIQNYEPLNQFIILGPKHRTRLMQGNSVRELKRNRDISTCMLVLKQSDRQTRHDITSLYDKDYWVKIIQRDVKERTRGPVTKEAALLGELFQEVNDSLVIGHFLLSKLGKVSMI